MEGRAMSNRVVVDNEKAGKRNREMKGRVIKIKTGYNPNSSSIGVDVIAFFTAGAAMTVLFNTIAAVVSAAREHERPEELREPAVIERREEQG
jgi:hypothetical protein